MSIFEIPVVPGTPQQFRITFGGVERLVTLKWNSYSESWVADFADASGVNFLTGVPLVTGADLFEQFAYLDLGGQLVARGSETGHDDDAVPTFDDLGTTAHLYFATP